jgi:hypothetical protein
MFSLFQILQVLTYHGVITAIRFNIKKTNIPINDLEKLNGPLIPNIIKKNYEISQKIKRHVTYFKFKFKFNKIKM